jgi:hypothetical protein
MARSEAYGGLSGSQSGMYRPGEPIKAPGRASVVIDGQRVPLRSHRRASDASRAASDAPATRQRRASG